MANEVTSDVPPSRRAAHKLRTERALQQAALELFAKNGYDETTTDEIAEQAGVSPRTFFRYFPTKESVLFVGEVVWIQALTTAFLAQPDSLTDLEAMRDTLVAFAPRFIQSRKSQILYERAVASSPTLRGRVVEHQQADVGAVAMAVASRRGLEEPSDGCYLLSAVALVTHRRALDRWLEGPATADPGTVIQEFFDHLSAMLGPASH